MCIYCKVRCFLLSNIILINSNPNNKHLLNRNFVYINEREVVQNVKITCAASDINHKCIWSYAVALGLGVGVCCTLAIFSFSEAACLLRCPEMYFVSNFNFYIAKTPCQYDNKEILMQLGLISGPSFFRFRN